MALYHVSLAFAQLPDNDLDTFAVEHVTKMTGNTNFATPAVPLTQITTAQVAFDVAITGTLQGGTQATITKKNTRATLVALLRQQAQYVELTAKNDPTIILSSGFDINSQSNTSTPLDQTAIISVTNGASTILLATLQVISNAKAYDVEVSTDGTSWTHAVTSTKSRGIVVPNLKPGTMYYLRARAVGGSTGYGNWSDPVQHMAT
jgi:hypothetical protein